MIYLTFFDHRNSNSKSLRDFYYAWFLVSFVNKYIFMNTLTFQIRLENNVIQLKNIESFIGKEVIISIIELPKYQKKKKRKWNFLGAVSLNKQLDDINIRDFAYE